MFVVVIKFQGEVVGSIVFMNNVTKWEHGVKWSKRRGELTNYRTLQSLHPTGDGGSETRLEYFKNADLSQVR